MNKNAALGVDINRETGEIIVGWSQVLQSLSEIFETHFGERTMREWFGSTVPLILGENMTAPTIINFFAAISAAVSKWEPRYRITQIKPVSVNRNGHFNVQIDGVYLPLALIGNFEVEGARQVIATGTAGKGLVVL